MKMFSFSYTNNTDMNQWIISFEQVCLDSSWKWTSLKRNKSLNHVFVQKSLPLFYYIQVFWYDNFNSIYLINLF